MMQIVCHSCGLVHEFNYTGTYVDQLIADGWRAAGGFLFCPKDGCAKRVISKKQDAGGKVRSYTLKVFREHRSQWYKEHPAKKNAGRNTEKWKKEFQRQWDAARDDVSKALEEKRKGEMAQNGVVTVETST